MNRNGRQQGHITVPRSKKPVLITGGAGFIGTNLAHRFLSAGQPVVLFDTLARRGVERNLEWLRREHGHMVDVIVADVRDLDTLKRVTRDVSRVFHLAAQVAVTTSLDEPCEDFEVNARGTLNVLEALRALVSPPPLLFTSTKKVYGRMTDVPLRAADNRYEPIDSQLREHGFSEDQPLQFHSPHGCSKGCAEQYVLDYARTYNLPAVVFRMSCIYGLHQLGNVDEGWVTHFLIRALEDEPITIHGDGRQVRDLLFVDDLVDAFLLAHRNMDRISGEVFNMGGGPQNTFSVLELIHLIEELQGKRPEVSFDERRPADQLFYVSDTRKFSTVTGWKAQVPVKQGIERLHNWLTCSKGTRILDVTDLVRTGGDGRIAIGDTKCSEQSLHQSARSKRIHQLHGYARETKLAQAV